MTGENHRTWARRLAWGAGGLDFATGLGMVLLPEVTLRLMRVEAPGAEALVYLRFVGAFVAAVGASYLLALRAGGDARLRAVLAFTIPFRLAAGTYCLVAILRGWLPPMWSSVPAADYGLVVAQAWLLRQRWGQAS